MDRHCSGKEVHLKICGISSWTAAPAEETMTRICNLVVFCCAEIEKVGSVDFCRRVSWTVSGEFKESQEARSQQRIQVTNCETGW